MKPGPKPMPVSRERKQEAYRIFKRALRRGEIVRQLCEECEKAGWPQRTDRIDAHHEDYDQPLAVIWLCPIHHAERHRELRQQHYPAPEQSEAAT